MNYLTAALQLVTLYGLYRLWKKESNVNIRLESDRPFEARQGEEVYQSALKKSSELANVKPEPKQAPPPPPVKHVYSKQMRLEMDEPKKEPKKKNHGRTMQSLTDSQIKLLMFKMREYCDQRKKYISKKGKRPAVSRVFPLVGSNLKVLVVPALMSKEEYDDWRQYGRWAKVMQYGNEEVIEMVRMIPTK